MQFFDYFLAFFPYIWPLARPNIAKKGGRCKNWRGLIDKPILELLTFGSNPDFSAKKPKRQFFHYFFTSFSRMFWSQGRLR